MIQKDRLLRQSGLSVFDRKAIANILGISYPSTNPILYRLVKAGILTRLRRDRYVLRESASDATRKIANELLKPSALSLWTALSDAGATTQAPQAVQSVTPKRAAEIRSEGLPTFQYIHLPPMLCSIGTRPDVSGVFRASPEKALLDILYVQRGRMDWASVDKSAFNRKTLSSLARRYPDRVRRALAASLLMT